MMRKVICITAVLAVLFTALTACKKTSKIGDAPDADKPATEILPPMIPDSIQGADNRANYLVVHYWDNLDMNNTKQVRDSDFMEQSFSNYISVMPYCSKEALHESVFNLLSQSESHKGLYDYLEELAEKYLREADSPFRSEEFFLPFVDYALQRSNGSDERAAEMRAEIFRNAPGSIAPDVAVTALNGGKLHLIQKGAAPMTLIMFYEPDCDYCKNAIKILTGSDNLRKIVAEKSIRFVAVYIGDEKDLWKTHAKTLPSNWEVGIDVAKVIDNDELYVVRATPSFYLIDADGKIVLKDADINVLGNYLGL
jgi:glutaredoxin